MSMAFLVLAALCILVMAAQHDMLLDVVLLFASIAMVVSCVATQAV